MSRIRLSDQFCKSVAPPSQGNRLYRCADTKGLALRVTAQAARSFVFCFYNSRRVERRMTIGRYPAWSLKAARKRADELRRQVDRGEDPLEEREAARAAEDLSTLWTWYEETNLPSLAPSSQSDTRSVWSRIILPLLGPRTRLEDLQRRDVQGMVDRASVEFGPVIANRAHSYLRRALNLAVAEGWLERNVATMAIRRNAEHPRERFLTHEEFVRLMATLDDIGTVTALCLKFIALTGCRRSEALTARWSDIDLARGVWSKPPSRTKTRRRHVVPLNSGAVEVLKQTARTAPSKDRVFPGRDPAQSLVELKATWRIIRRRLNIHDVRIHDLRHTFASFVAAGGRSLQEAGALLGHSQVATTARYTHLFDDALRAASETVSAHISELPACKRLQHTDLPQADTSVEMPAS